MNRFLLGLFLFISPLLFAEEDEETLTLTRTEHSLELEGISMPYTAITGEIPIHDCEGDEMGELFFIAYMKDEETPTQRPITFLFPGGPGGCGSLEVVCTVAPRRILTPDEGKPLLPPYTLIDNPETLLPWTDLVFVDPIGTGYSQLFDDDEAGALFTVDGDIRSLGEFVSTFLSYFERWNCPKYLMGGSYGTVRCGGLAEHLRFAYGISLHGIILLGSAIDLNTLISQTNHPLPDCLLIPTFAATAWYHGRLWPEVPLEEVISYARRFAFSHYLPAILQPTRLSLHEEEAFYKELSTLIGLPIDTVRRYRGRLNEGLYTSEFFAAERKILGGLDSRYVGEHSEIHPWGYTEDPSYKDMQGIVCAFHEYLSRELDTKRPFEPYVGFSSAINRNWLYYFTYDSFLLPDLFQRIRRTLVHNREMKVFVGSGYYDCRTPFAATEYCFDQLHLPASFRENFQFEYYEAGHGFIFDYPSLKKLKADLAKFYGK